MDSATILMVDLQSAEATALESKTQLTSLEEAIQTNLPEHLTLKLTVTLTQGR